MRNVVVRGRYIISFCVLLFSVSAFSQIVVKGTVTDQDNMGMPGANVLVKGTTNGTITDIDGNYSISVPSEKAILVYSFIGMSTREVPVGKQKVINVTLKDDGEMLDEVVVVGYGAMKKRDLTGAVSSYRPSEQEAGKIISIDNMLQGKIAGLSVGTAVDAPGAAASVTIRGANSLRGDNQPLYVIDNIPQASTGEFASTGSGDRDVAIATDALSSLNPADIESIEVLKDASATAIYGSRGANGVILITTKKGKSGKAKVSASANFTIATAARLMDMMSLEEFAKYRLIKGGNYTKDSEGNWNLFVKDENTGQMKWNEVFQYHIDGHDVYRKNDPESKASLWERLDAINWQKEIYSSALSQNYSVSMNGGTDKITYFASAGYKDIQGLVQGTGLKQGDFRLNLNTNLSKSVTIDLSLNGSIKQNDMMSGGNATGGATGSIADVALYSAPYVRSAEELAKLDNIYDRATVWTWVDDFDDTTKEKTFRGSLDLSWKICDFLTYNLRSGGNIIFQNRDRWYGVTLYTGSMQNGYVNQVTFNRSNYSVENILQFNKSIKKIVNINATAGVTYDAYESLNTILVGNNFSVYDLRSQGIHLAGNQEIKQPIQKNYQLLSYLARVNLSFLEGRYLLTASVRADGSSKFSPNSRWATFPAATVAWRLEEEPFMKDLPWLNQLKMRLGYGETGSQSIDPYSTFSSYAGKTDDGRPTQSASGDGTKLVGLLVDKMQNEDLRWERTSSYNFGIDFSFLKDRFGGTVDLYSKTTKDLLIQRDLPASTGFNTLTVNQGSLRNKGIEVTLRGDLIRTKSFTWNLQGNIAFNQARILDFGLPESAIGNHTLKHYLGASLGDQYKEANIFAVGYAPGLFFGYKTDGIIQKEDPYLKDVIKTIGSLAPGELKFVDLNGDHIIDEKDRTFIGDPNPDFTYGIQTSFTWKDLSLSFAFNGVYGNDILNANARSYRLPSSTSGMIQSKAFHNMWREDNPWNGAYYGNEMPSASATLPKVVFDKYIEDGSFLRCSDITLAYNLPKSVIQKIGFTNIRCYLSVKNAFIITNYSGYDPEVNTFAFDGTRPGIDLSSYPHTRSFIMGLNVSF